MRFPILHLPSSIFLLLSLLTLSARGDDGWTLTTAAFEQQAVSLEGLAEGGVNVTPVGGEQRMVRFENFLSLERPGAGELAQEKFTLRLLNGDRVPGEPLGVNGESLSFKTPALGELLVPLQKASSLVRMGKTVDPGSAERTEDLVMLANGDRLKGVVLDLTPAKLTVHVNNNSIEVPLETVDGIFFALASKPVRPEGRQFRVRLRDGSSVTAGSATSNGQKLSITLLDGSKKELALSAVSGIEQVNGPVAWLSSETPAAVVQTPFFGSVMWPTRMDQTVGGKPISFNGRTYTRGIGVHAYSLLEYPLDGNYGAFRTQYAISQEEKRQYANVTVRIKVDEKVVHEQAEFGPDVLSEVVRVELPKEAKKLTLEVDYGSANDTQDRFNWIEPALLKAVP